MKISHILLILSSLTALSANALAEWKSESCENLELMYKDGSSYGRVAEIKKQTYGKEFYSWNEDDFKKLKEELIKCRDKNFLKNYSQSVFSQNVDDAIDELKKLASEESSKSQSSTLAQKYLESSEKQVDNLTKSHSESSMKQLTQIRTDLEKEMLKYAAISGISTRFTDLLAKIDEYERKNTDLEIIKEQDEMTKRDNELIKKENDKNKQALAAQRSKSPEIFKKCEQLRIQITPLEKEQAKYLNQAQSSSSDRLRIE
jgi:hypothetical protein